MKETANYKKYAPLTDEQKKEMCDKEIELWEEKSKEGLALPFVKKLLGRGTPERGRFAFFHPGILLL